MILRRSKRERNYSVIDNEVINDQRLSGLARAVLIYILSKPDDWTIRKADIYKQFPKDTKNAITTALKALRDTGYSQLKAIRTNENLLAGQEYVFTDSPSCHDRPRTEILEPRGSLAITKDGSLLLNTDKDATKKKSRKRVSKIKEDTPESLEEFVTRMTGYEDRALRLIGKLASEIRPNFTTKAQWTAFKDRHIRAARKLEVYSSEQIQEAYKRMKAANCISKWTLETVAKYLDCPKEKERVYL